VADGAQRLRAAEGRDREGAQRGDGPGLAGGVHLHLRVVHGHRHAERAADLRGAGADGHDRAVGLDLGAVLAGHEQVAALELGHVVDDEDRGGEVADRSPQLEAGAAAEGQDAGALGQLDPVARADLTAVGDDLALAAGPLDRGPTVDLEAGLALARAVVAAGTEPEEGDGERSGDQAGPGPHPDSPSGAGKTIAKVEPRPGAEVQDSPPPWARTIRLAGASPRPRPPKRRVSDPSIWAKSSKIVSRRSAGMPTPLSVTVTATPGRPPSSVGDAPTTMRPPPGEYFT